MVNASGLDRAQAETAMSERDPTPKLLLIPGALYLGAIVFRDALLTTMGIPSSLSMGYLQQHALAHAAANLALRAPALAVALIIWVRYPKSLARRSLEVKYSAIIPTLILTFTLSLLLNFFGIWPFTWRWATNSSSAYFSLLTASGQWVGVLLWAATLIVVNPLLEEVIFRVGLLQSVREWTGSKQVAIVVSATCFGLAHLGYLPPQLANVVNASWLFLASLLLGAITFRRAGRIDVSLSAHVIRNMIEFLFLLLAIHHITN